MLIISKCFRVVNVIANSHQNTQNNYVDESLFLWFFIPYTFRYLPHLRNTWLHFSHKNERRKFLKVSSDSTSTRQNCLLLVSGGTLNVHVLTRTGRSVASRRPRSQNITWRRVETIGTRRLCTDVRSCHKVHRCILYDKIISLNQQCCHYHTIFFFEGPVCLILSC